MAMSILFLNNSTKIKVLFVILFCITTKISAQTAKKNLTLQMEGVPLIEVFHSITSQTGFRFAYNSNVLDENVHITVNVEKENLDTVLLLILPNSVKYKKISDYIILTSVGNTNKDEKEKVDSLALNHSNGVIIASDTVYLHKNNDTILELLNAIKQELTELKVKKIREKGNWIISISAGLRSEFFSATNYNRVFSNNKKISFPSLEFGLGYVFSTRLQLETGIKYIENYADYSFEAFSWSKILTQSERHLLYSSLQIPLCLKYYIPLGKSNIYLLTKAGVDLSIPLTNNQYDLLTDQQSVTDDFLWNSLFTGQEVSTSQKLYYSTVLNAPLHKVNILLNLGLGLSYQFKFGMGLTLFGEYYAGTMNMAQLIIPYHQEQFNSTSNTWEFYSEGKEFITFRGDYWNAGLTISYKF